MSCVVPVALIFVKLPVPELRVAIFPVVILAEIAVRVFINAVANDKIFPRIFVTVVEASVVEPALKFVVERFVEVELVIVPLAALIFERETFPADRFVTVALVKVELVITPPLAEIFVTTLVDA